MNRCFGLLFVLLLLSSSANAQSGTAPAPKPRSRHRHPAKAHKSALKNASTPVPRALYGTWRLTNVTGQTVLPGFPLDDKTLLVFRRDGTMIGTHAGRITSSGRFRAIKRRRVYDEKPTLAGLECRIEYQPVATKPSAQHAKPKVIYQFVSVLDAGHLTLVDDEAKYPPVFNLYERVRGLD